MDKELHTMEDSGVWLLIHAYGTSIHAQCHLNAKSNILKSQMTMYFQKLLEAIFVIKCMLHESFIQTHISECLLLSWTIIVGLSEN